MKTLPIFLYFLFSCSYLSAQQKHSFSLGVDYVRTALAKEWNKSDNLSITGSANSPIDDMALHFTYYYKNKYAAKLNVTAINQYAHVIRKDQAFSNFLSEREAGFFDLMMGYNLNSLYYAMHPESYWNKVGIWTWAGASLLSGESSQSRSDYDPAGGYESVWPRETVDYSKTIRPVAQIMVKYNPIRYVFIGIGATYRYIASDFQPVSLNVSLGFQL